jgi:hypothetical protein
MHVQTTVCLPLVQAAAEWHNSFLAFRSSAGQLVVSEQGIERDDLWGPLGQGPWLSIVSPCVTCCMLLVAGLC